MLRRRANARRLEAWRAKSVPAAILRDAGFDTAPRMRAGGRHGGNPTWIACSMAGKADQPSAVGQSPRWPADDAPRQRRCRRPLSLQSPARRHHRDRRRLLHGAWSHICRGRGSRVMTGTSSPASSSGSGRRGSTSGSKLASRASRSFISRRSSIRPFARRCARPSAGEVWLAGTKYLPVWPSRWILPCVGALMLVYLLLRVASDIARGRSTNAPEA